MPVLLLASSHNLQCLLQCLQKRQVTIQPVHKLGDTKIVFPRLDPNEV